MHVDLTLLLDLKGSAYLTSGVLPRKKLSLPKAFLSASFRSLEPTFRVGPLLTVSSKDGAVPILPTPQIAGYDARWVEDRPYGAAEHEFRAGDITPVPSAGIVPRARVEMTRGWLRMQPRQRGTQ